MKPLTPFNTAQKPKNPFSFLMPIEWIGSLFFLARAKGGKITYHRIENAFSYDDYAWQAENKVKIHYQNRARGLHRILYRCPVCQTEFETDSDGDSLWCNRFFCEKRKEDDKTRCGIHGRIR